MSDESTPDHGGEVRGGLSVVPTRAVRAAVGSFVAVVVAVVGMAIGLLLYARNQTHNAGQARADLMALQLENRCRAAAANNVNDAASTVYAASANEQGVFDSLLTDLARGDREAFRKGVPELSKTSAEFKRAAAAYRIAVRGQQERNAACAASQP